MKRFAKTIVKVLLAYADIVKREFPEHMSDERMVFIQSQIFVFGLVYKCFFTGLYVDEQYPTT